MRGLAASHEANVAGQRGTKPLEIFSSWNLLRTQVRGVVIQELNVEEPKSAFAEPLDQMNESDFGGVSATGKHRLAGEETAHGNSVNATDELVIAPRLDAMSVAQAMQRFIGFDHLLVIQVP